MLFVKFGKKLVAPEEVLGFLLVPLGPLVPVFAKYFGHDKIIMIESICRLVWHNKRTGIKIRSGASFNIGNNLGHNLRVLLSEELPNVEVLVGIQLQLRVRGWFLEGNLNGKLVLVL